MSRTTGMIHVVPDNAALFGRIAAQVMSDLKVIHFVDGGLPEMGAAELRPRVIHRLRTLARFAWESGAEAILLTCTAFGRLADEVQTAVDCPVISVLELVIDAAGYGETIGIIGSHPSTLTMAAQMVRERTAREHREVEVRTRLCPGAFEAMQRGDLANHDSIVQENLRELAAQVDVVIAPQPSLERAVRECASSSGGSRAVTSPTLAILRLKELVDSLS